MTSIVSSLAAAVAELQAAHNSSPHDRPWWWNQFALFCRATSRPTARSQRTEHLAHVAEDVTRHLPACQTQALIALLDQMASCREFEAKNCSAEELSIRHNEADKFSKALDVWMFIYETVFVARSQTLNAATTTAH